MIFLDLTKAYDALDRTRSLEILEGYGVEQWVRRLLQVNWNTSKIYRLLDLSKASYALVRSRKITYRTSYLMAASCCNSLASRVAVPVPRPARKPCSAS